MEVLDFDRGLECSADRLPLLVSGLPSFRRAWAS